jgi:hypothetical protein
LALLLLLYHLQWRAQWLPHFRPQIERTSHFPSEMTLSASEPAKPHMFKDIGARTS